MCVQPKTQIEHKEQKKGDDDCKTLKHINQIQLTSIGAINYNIY